MAIFSRMLGVCAAAGIAAAMASPASALLVQPVVIDLQTSGEHTNAAITITNDRNRPDTVEVSVNKLTLPEKGAPVLTPVNGDNFLIFPPTATIQPGHTQVIRIRWVGEPVLAQSQTYMFATSELPIANAKGTGIQLLYSIQSLVTVTSPTLKPDVHVISAVRDTETHPA
jgi:fimbrial chaperone protein